MSKQVDQRGLTLTVVVWLVACVAAITVTGATGSEFWAIVVAVAGVGCGLVALTEAKLHLGVTTTFLWVTTVMALFVVCYGIYNNFWGAKYVDANLSPKDFNGIERGSTLTSTIKSSATRKYLRVRFEVKQENPFEPACQEGVRFLAMLPGRPETVELGPSVEKDIALGSPSGQQREISVLVDNANPRAQCKVTVSVSGRLHD